VRARRRVTVVRAGRVTVVRVRVHRVRRLVRRHGRRVVTARRRRVSVVRVVRRRRLDAPVRTDGLGRLVVRVRRRRGVVRVRGRRRRVVRAARVRVVLVGPGRGRRSGLRRRVRRRVGVVRVARVRRGGRVGRRRRAVVRARGRRVDLDRGRRANVSALGELDARAARGQEEALRDTRRGKAEGQPRVRARKGEQDGTHVVALVRALDSGDVVRRRAEEVGVGRDAERAAVGRRLAGREVVGVVLRCGGSRVSLERMGDGSTGDAYAPKRSRTWPRRRS